MDVLISIIVPAYNAEKTICKCVYSLVNQTYKNVEIIVVDDGSTDRTGIIIDNLKIKDNRITVIHKENRGVSHSRNIGIERAKGTYICFVDADDWVAPNYVEQLLYSIKITNADIAICGHCRITEDKTFDVYKGQQEIFTAEGALVELLSMGKIGNAIWDKLFKKELFDGNRFPETQIVNEELFVIINAFERSKQIVNTGKILYSYMLSEGSASQAYTIDKAKTVIDNLDRLKKWSLNANYRLRRATQKYISYFEGAVSINLVRNKLKTSDIEFYRALQTRVRRHSLANLFNNNIPFSFRVKCILQAMGVYPILIFLVKKNK